MATRSETPEALGSFTVSKPASRGPQWIRYPANPLDSLIQDLKLLGTHHTGYLYVPDGDPEIFNDPTVKYELTGIRTYKPESVLKVLTGPVVLGENDGRNALLEYAQDGLIQLYRRAFRGATSAFRIIETGDEYIQALVEHPNRLFTPFSKRLVSNFDNRYLSPHSWNNCQQLLQIFEMDKPEHMAFIEPGSPLVVPESKLEDLHRLADIRDQSVDYLSYEQIKDLLKES